MDNTISMPIDYYITVSLSDDKLTAFLQFNNDDSQLKFTVGQLVELLNSNKIEHGILHDVLAQIANSPKDFFYNKITVAVGDTPKDGDNGYVNFLFDLDNESKKPTEMEDGTVDYKEVTTLLNVRKGQLIAERFFAKEGTNGKAVTGELIISKKGKEARFKIGKNVVTDAENKALYAAIDGLIVKTEAEKINVFPIFEVNGDIDYNTGNIEFIGSVVIRGNVLSGFKVKAAGDIRIIGGVEGAELEAGGSIEISAGIMANNKGSVKAGRSVKTSFIQEGNVESVEDVIVSQSIMHSRIRAGRDVLCRGSKGLIVGGTVQAGERVVARTIGNTMSTVTIIEVGVLPQLRNELMQLRGQLKLLIENLDKTDKALTLLDQMAASGMLNQDKAALRSKLSYTKKQTHEEQSTIKDRISEIEESLEDTDKAKIEVMNNIYSGTKIVIGRYTRYVKDSISRVSFQMSVGEIVMSSNVSKA